MWLRLWLITLIWLGTIALTTLIQPFFEDICGFLTHWGGEVFPWERFFFLAWSLLAVLSILSVICLSLQYLIREKTDTLGGLGRGSFIVACLVGLVLRLTLAPFFGHMSDMVELLIGGYMVGHGYPPYWMDVTLYHGPDLPLISSEITRRFWSIAYPPVWPLLSGVSYLVSDLLIPNNLFAYVFTLKIWIIAADFGVAYLIYRLVSGVSGVEVARRAAAYYLLCPLVLLAGVVWGMPDALCALTVLLSLLLFGEGRRSLSAFCLGLGFGVKFYPVIFTPVFLLALGNWRERVSYMTVLASTILALIISPQVLWGNSPTSITQLSLGQATRTRVGLTAWRIPDYAIFLSRHDESLWAWQSLLSNPLANGLWLLPMMWLTYIWWTQRNPSTNSVSCLLSRMISIQIVFLTFRLWASEQMYLPLFTLALLKRYLHGSSDHGFTRMTWVSVSLYIFMNTRLGFLLCLPIWGSIRGVAAYVSGGGWIHQYYARILSMLILTVFQVSYSLIQILQTVKKTRR